MLIPLKANKMNSYFKMLGYVLVFVVAFFLVSCESESQSPVKETSPLKKVSVVKKANKKASANNDHEKADEREDTSQILFYDPKGRRDPFLPFIKPKLSKAEKEDNAKVLVGLQKYDVKQLKVVAIIWGIDNPTAMVEDPERKGYVLKKGSLVGKRNGRVVAILKDRIVIRENYRDAFGERKSTEVFLELPKEEDLMLQ